MIWYIGDATAYPRPEEVKSKFFNASAADESTTDWYLLFTANLKKLIGAAALVVVDPWSILATLTGRRCVAAIAERHCEGWVRPAE